MNNSTNLHDNINNINNNINNIYYTLNIISNSMLMSQNHTMMNDLRRNDIRRQFLNTRMPDLNRFTPSTHAPFRTSTPVPEPAPPPQPTQISPPIPNPSYNVPANTTATLATPPPAEATEPLNSQRRDMRSIITSLLRNEIPNVRSMEISVMGIPRESEEVEENIVISHHNVYNNTKIYNKIYDEDLDESDYEQCSICLETIKNNDIVREINKCKHCFHVECADKWFEEKITCPNCRQDIRIEIVN